VYAFNATIEIEGSTFTENTVQDGYLLDADNSVAISTTVPSIAM